MKNGSIKDRLCEEERFEKTQFNSENSNTKKSGNSTKCSIKNIQGIKIEQFKIQIAGKESIERSNGSKKNLSIHEIEWEEIETIKQYQGEMLYVWFKES